MVKRSNICDFCGHRNVCKHKNKIRIVCHFAMMHFNFNLPPTCFDCLNHDLCLEHYKYDPKNFKCTGIKTLLKEALVGSPKN